MSIFRCYSYDRESLIDGTRDILGDEETWIDNHFENLEELHYSVLDPYDTKRFISEIADTEDDDELIAWLEDTWPEVFDVNFLLADSGDYILSEYSIIPCVIIKEHKTKDSYISSREIIAVFTEPANLIGDFLAHVIEKKNQQPPSQPAEQVVSTCDPQLSEKIDQIAKVILSGPLHKAITETVPIDTSTCGVGESKPVIEEVEQVVEEKALLVVEEAPKPPSKQGYRSKLNIFQQGRIRL